ncbi:hypothetical protein L2E82_09106 [Cichorium intybus]|uniref:Uncharacterized protein n=1 Tax=Cichorium intybus TaxID=13427 RepID=A0ACB9G8K9_CICIN|nr:hypothetical protein L2E82_09106 [Cichorium intybus]
MNDSHYAITCTIIIYSRVEYPATCGQMDDNSCNGGSDNIDWNTDDELEIANISSPSSVSLNTNGAFISEFEFGESSSSSNSPSKLVDYINMGFCEAMVTKVIAEIGENDSDAILDALLTYSALDEIPHQEHELNDPCLNPESDFENDLSDFDTSCSEEDSNESFEKDDPLVCLIDMGYSHEEASAAISRCGKDAPLSELVDFISAAHISKEADATSYTSALQSYSHPLRFLYDIEPEFVDSKFFCPAARKRGYIHNLPLNNRFSIQPLPPYTIFEALPETKKWWPSWDKREQLNCILTCRGSAQLTDRIRLALESCKGEPNVQVKKYVIGQ